eukprot:TRINITY_DN15566_c0_g1_i1.p1 TRINITY_DN15566_c0_g1~~TRINITY_DN15566_c0_g1_i1.p1  ORF type:complete len:517 (+),score=103.34 TRINITY_DN15566_c0_g1_i1:64-1614(+)
MANKRPSSFDDELCTKRINAAQPPCQALDSELSFLALPDDVLDTILANLTAGDRCRVRHVCTRIRELVDAVPMDIVLQHVDASGIRNGTTLAAQLQVWFARRNLSSLTLHQMKLDWDNLDLSVVQQVACVRQLTIRSLPQEALLVSARGLATLTALTALNISGFIEPAAMLLEALRPRLPFLSQLQVAVCGSAVTAADLQLLETCAPQLQMIGLPFACELRFTGFPELTYLEITSGVSATTLQSLTLPKLQSIVLHQLDVCDDSADAFIRRHPLLREFSCGCAVAVGMQDYQPYCGLERVKIISRHELEWPLCDDPPITTTLKELIVTSHALRPGQMLPLVLAPNVKILRYYASDATQQLGTLLRCATQLEVLDVCYIQYRRQLSQLYGAQLLSMAHLSRLRELVLRNTQLTSGDLPLRMMPLLEHLDLSFNAHITDVLLYGLIENGHQLKFLSVTGTAATIMGVTDCARALTQLRTLHIDFLQGFDYAACLKELRTHCPHILRVVPNQLLSRFVT